MMVYGLRGKWLRVLDALGRAEEAIAKKKARGQEVGFGLHHARNCAIRGLDNLQSGPKSAKLEGGG